MRLQRSSEPLVASLRYFGLARERSYSMQNIILFTAMGLLLAVGVLAYAFH
jgi:hypothetical protein